MENNFCCIFIFAGDFCKLRGNADSNSASSGSPPANMFHHSTAPMNQLRDMLLTDMEHSNSNDNNDVKDLSFRNQPQQAPVITSTAPPIIHLDTSNHDFDSSRASSVQADNGTIPTENGDGVMRSMRVRKLSDSSHNTDHEHNHSYKFKNYIQQRFSQDNSGHVENGHHEHENGDRHHDSSHADDEKTVDEPVRSKKPKLFNTDFGECSSCDEAKPTSNHCIGDFKSEPTTNPYQLFTKPTINGSSRYVHNPVPIFALHSQGRHYVPLNVEYDALVPYLNGFDLLDKSCTTMTPCHPININVNFVPTNRTKISNTFNGRSKSENVMCNGW